MEGGQVVGGLEWVGGFIWDYFVINLREWCNDINKEDLMLISSFGKKCVNSKGPHCTVVHIRLAHIENM